MANVGVLTVNLFRHNDAYLNEPQRVQLTEELEQLRR